MKKGQTKSRTLPPRLQGVRDPREIFIYLLKKARFGPDYCLWPDEGPLRRVVLFSHFFRDSTVDTFEQIPNFPKLLEGVDELRLVATRIGPKAIDRLRKLIPKVSIVTFTDEEWEQNVALANAAYDRKSGKMNAWKRELDVGSDIGTLLRERYGGES